MRGVGGGGGNGRHQERGVEGHRKGYGAHYSWGAVMKGGMTGSMERGKRDAGDASVEGKGVRVGP